MTDEIRFAACDVGSNAVRLVVSRVVGKDECFLQREASYRVPLRLGEDAFSEQRLSTDTIDALVEVFSAFSALLRFFRPKALRACATSALREAQNGHLAAQRVEEVTGIPLEIVSGAEEASILFATHLDRGLSSQHDYLYVDVGGGSTELTLMAAGRVAASSSFRIGGVRLLKERVDPEEFEKMKGWVKALRSETRAVDAIGTGGNISKIYDLVVSTPGGRLSRRQIERVCAALEPLSLEERMRRFQLKPDRADVIVPVAHVYRRVMKWGRIESMVVPKCGVADGILCGLFEQHFGCQPVAAVKQSLLAPDELRE